MSTDKKHFGSSPTYITEHRSAHPNSRTILLTGSTAGIGLAIAKHLLSSKDQHLLFLTGRNRHVLKHLEADYADRVLTSAGDMGDLDYVKSILQDLSVEGKLDGLVLNHGTLGNCSRLADMQAEEWENVFRINVTSCVALIQQALPFIRTAKGRIIFTSSGAAQNAYSSWGAYGASKAAINHLTMTLKNEEPEVTTIAIRPGVVDTAMQKDIRETFLKNMDEKDQAKFLAAKDEGKLLPPEKPGNVIANLAVNAKKDLSGLFLSWDDPKLEEYRA